MLSQPFYANKMNFCYTLKKPRQRAWTFQRLHNRVAWTWKKDILKLTTHAKVNIVLLACFQINSLTQNEAADVFFGHYLKKAKCKTSVFFFRRINQRNVYSEVETKLGPFVTLESFLPQYYHNFWKAIWIISYLRIYHMEFTWFLSYKNETSLFCSYPNKKSEFSLQKSLLAKILLLIFRDMFWADHEYHNIISIHYKLETKALKEHFTTDPWKIAQLVS